MSDEVTGSTGGEAISAVELPADAPAEFSSVNDALTYLSSLDEKRKQSPAESADTATAETKSSGEDDAAPRDEATGEDQEADPAELPPLELPRSWTKEQAEHWKALPRETQEYLTERASKDSEAIRKVQNEAAEKLKGLTAKEQQAEQVKQQYEAKLADQMQSLLDFNDQQFSNIKSQADVDFLANEALRLSQNGDPVTAGQYTAYLNAWQAHQQKMAGKRLELDQANQRKVQEKQTEARERKSRENSLLIEKAPEYADAAKLDTAQKAAAALFREKGFTPEQLANIIDENPILDDHRMQLIIDDACKYRGVMKAKTAVTQIPVPPVQRPGTTRATSDASEREQTLTRKPDLTVKEATELYEMQSRRARRA